MLDAKKRTDEAIGAWEALKRDSPEYARQVGLDARIAQAKKSTE